MLSKRFLATLFPILVTSIVTLTLNLEAGRSLANDAQPSGERDSDLEQETEEAQKIWIFFRDKGPSTLSKSPAVLQRAQERLSTRALKRRAKVLSQDKLVDETDVELYAPYLAELEKLGLEIVSRSRWLNAVSVMATPQQVATIERLSFVESTRKVARLSHPPAPEETQPSQELGKVQAPHRLEYGPSLAQMEQIKAVTLHDAGITGRKVLVGMMDSGFRWQEHEAFSRARKSIIDERDFINDDELTRNEVGDPSGQDSHGTATFSTLAGYKPGQLIGPAFDATFLLAKTEDISSETHVEEDYWVEAVEWMEGLGVDVTSTSLGYTTFDQGQSSYTPSDMDGNTAIITKAAELAASKGVIVVNSAGNEGSDPDWRIISAPADGPSVIAVGAVTSQGNVTNFSSRGPTADGRIKPDVMAMGSGVQTATVGTTSGYGFSGGTSFSCPLAAGVVAQIVSAHPEVTPSEMLNALRSTASLTSSPNNDLGYGIVDSRAAITSLGPAFSNVPEILLENPGFLDLTIRILSRDGIVPNSVYVHYADPSSADFVLVSLTKMDSISYYGQIPRPAPDTSHVKIYFSATDLTFGERTIPRNAPEDFLLVRGDGVINGVTPPEPLPTEFQLEQNRPNPFGPATFNDECNSNTCITYTLLDETPVRIKVYNVLGQLVREFTRLETSQGRHVVPWDGRDDAGRLVASGTYVYLITTPGWTARKKLTFLR